MDAFIEKLKIDIIEQLHLEELSPESIGPDDQLFGEGLGIDSIDALELNMMLEQKYGLRIEDSKLGRKVFKSLRSLAEYIVQNKPELNISK